MKLIAKICGWIALILFIASILSALLGISIYGSTYIVFYGFSVLGLIIGLIGWIILRFQSADNTTKIIGNIGFFSNFAIVVLFYDPIYHVWRNWIFGS